jgi:hypothetical protein
MTREPVAGSDGLAAPAGRAPVITRAILVRQRSAAQIARDAANLAASQRPLLTDGLYAAAPRRGRDQRKFPLNWRHPLAIPMVLSLILIGPVVLAVMTILKLWNWVRQKTGAGASKPSRPVDENDPYLWFGHHIWLSVHRFGSVKFFSCTILTLLSLAVVRAVLDNG